MIRVIASAITHWSWSEPYLLVDKINTSRSGVFIPIQEIGDKQIYLGHFIIFLNGSTKIDLNDGIEFIGATPHTLREDVEKYKKSLKQLREVK